MPINKKFSRFTKKRVSNEDNNYGVYEIADSDGNVLYIGEGKIRSRLESHIGGKGSSFPGASQYRVEYTKGKRRAEERERALLREFRRRHNKLPQFNQRDEI